MPQNAVGLLSSKATPTQTRASPISAKPGLRSPKLKQISQMFSTARNVFHLFIVTCLPVHKSKKGKPQLL